VEDWGEPPDLSGALGLRVDVENGTECENVQKWERQIVRSSVVCPAGHPGVTYAYSVNVHCLVEMEHYCFDYVSLRLDDEMVEPDEPPDSPFDDRFVVFQGEQCGMECQMGEMNGRKVILLLGGSDLTLEYDTVDARYHVDCFAEIPSNSQMLYQGASQPPSVP
jgi:hypothetical protein